MVETTANTVPMHDSSHAFCSANPSQSHCDITGDIEFRFWDSFQSINDDHAIDSFGGSQVKIQDTEARGEKEKIAGLALVWPLLGTSKNSDSTVYPCSSNHGNMSPNSRTRAIADGRRQLMKAVEDWSEWSHELSLKDIVDEEQGKEDMHVDNTKEDRSKDSAREAKLRKQHESRNSQTYKTGKMTRMESMDKESFLLKMFFPTFRNSKKKSEEVPCTKFCLMPKFKDSSELVGTKSWSQRQLLSGENQSTDNKKSSISRMSERGRYKEDSQSFGCWPFSITMKGNSRRSRML